MKAQGLIERQRSCDDERKVIVCLTEHGKQLQTAAAKILELFVSGLLNASMSLDDLKVLRDKLTILIDHLSSQDGALDD